MGYRMPTIFNEESEPYAYKGISPINFESKVAERSYGTNIDFKYQSTFGTDNILLTLNQMFFYNIIDNPITFTKNFRGIVIDSEGNSHYTVGPYFDQRKDSLLSKVFESQIKLTVGKFTWFFGYTYTDAYLEDGENKTTLTLTPKHSIKGDLLFVVEDKWRIGWDYDYKSEQLLSTNLRSPRLFSTGIVVERTIGSFVIFLNAENFTDARQSKYEKVQENGSPQFAEVWAPLDGYFFNMGLKIKL
jgi:iron complex outermembrane receptor protein